ncbi:adhesion G-protein coupled receptor G2-like isoform X2 [Ptychodera flava]|uniref:adhesion G-protein coupled receptor G2-like isoform X2 n=1 Tax=Ptychodera flava TaxID=63121 RepID=UPI003969F313
MSIIIVCNSAVFVMVIQVLRKQSRPVSGRSSTVDQLRGAVAMLVLLGLAWVFSGFAAINYNQVGKDLQVIQIVFQCLFVTCIAFQGFYIFLFHCARNADVRHKWASILTGVHLLRDKRSRSSSKTCTTLNKTSSSSNSNTPAVTKLTKV